jgi:hypothetical protein
VRKQSNSEWIASGLQRGVLLRLAETEDCSLSWKTIRLRLSNLPEATFMKTTLINLAIGLVICFGLHSAAAGDKIDVSAVITKADAEAVLGTPVKDAKGRNKEGADGYYDSGWSYYAVKGDKALVFDVLVPGRDAPPHLAATMFSVLPPGGGKSTPVNALGDKAIFYHDKTGLDMLNILKGNILITIGMHGVPAKTALEQEKSVASKILARL